MNWRIDQFAYRQRLIENFDQAEVDRYAKWQSEITPEDDQAFLEDLSEAVHFKPGMRILDVGAGTGAMCRVLMQNPGGSITALEPVPTMCDELRKQKGLSSVKVVTGFCDHASDAELFPECSFDVVSSRQVINGLFDPMQAFHNWHQWLAPGGLVVIVDGMYDRSGWSGRWAQDVDVLPLSAIRSLATVPYLLESASYRVDHVGMMTRTNTRLSTKTPRFIVVARKTT